MRGTGSERARKRGHRAWHRPVFCAETGSRLYPQPRRLRAEGVCAFGSVIELYSMYNATTQSEGIATVEPPDRAHPNEIIKKEENVATRCHRTTLHFRTGHAPPRSRLKGVVPIVKHVATYTRSNNIGPNKSISKLLNITCWGWRGELHRDKRMVGSLGNFLPRKKYIIPANERDGVSTQHSLA